MLCSDETPKNMCLLSRLAKVPVHCTERMLLFLMTLEIVD
jgi:hypothetical protein